jgi:HEPN domain-containing protein/predicted nucleotidyltransferase
MVTLKEAKVVTHHIVKQLQPLSVVLFGSVAKKGFGRDLDLLIVIDDTVKTMDRVSLVLNKSLKAFYRKFDIDPFIVQRSVFEEYHRKGSPFLRLIAEEGRSLYMKNAMQEWLKQAEEELDTARYLFQGCYFKSCCYHAQQAIEKTMKALLFKKGWDLEKTHSMRRLIEIGRDYNIKTNMTDDDVVFVDNIYRGRYPIETGLLPLGEPTSDDAERAVKIAERVVKKAFKAQPTKKK